MTEAETMVGVPSGLIHTAINIIEAQRLWIEGACTAAGVNAIQPVDLLDASDAVQLDLHMTVCPDCSAHQARSEKPRHRPTGEKVVPLHGKPEKTGAE